MAMLLAAPSGSAAPSATLTAQRIDFAGSQQASGVLAALRIHSPTALPASFRLEGTAIDLHTENQTVAEANQAGFVTQRGGGDEHFAQATFRSEGAQAGVDLLVVPLGPHRPSVSLASTSLGLSSSDAKSVTEATYFDSTRPVLTADTAAAVRSATPAADAITVRGAFAVAVWGWNFTADSSPTVVTGSQQSSVLRDPATGGVLTDMAFQQIAQLRVADGSLVVADLPGAIVSLYTTDSALVSAGRATIADATGWLNGAGALSGRSLVADGDLVSTVGETGAALRVRLDSFQGQMAAGGDLLDLGRSGALRDASAGGSGLLSPSLRWSFGLGGSLLAMMLTLLVIKGPARTARFNRIQGRFEAKDYQWVLQRIEPFTGSRHYGRRAATLKAVSLLSLKDYREAALFLESIDPTHGPDSATKAFLQACAAAGLGQDSFALQHLTDCFRLDPTYVEEARTVPELAGYIPYFENGEPA